METDNCLRCEECGNMNKKTEIEEENHRLGQFSWRILSYLKEIAEISDMTGTEFRIFFLIHLAFKNYSDEEAAGKSGAFRIEFEERGPYYDEDIMELTGMCEDHWQHMKRSFMEQRYFHLICPCRCPCCNDNMNLCEEEEEEFKNPNDKCISLQNTKVKDKQKT